MAYRIEIIDEADEDLAALTARDRASLLDAIAMQCSTSPRTQRGIASGCGPIQSRRGSYTKKALKEPVVVTRGGKPVAALTALDADDWEDLVVSTDPRFIAFIERSRALHKPGTGIALEDIRRKYGLPPKPRRKLARKRARKARSSRP